MNVLLNFFCSSSGTRIQNNQIDDFPSSLWDETMIIRKSGVSIPHVSNISHHTTGNRSCWLYHQIRQTAIIGTQSQPSFWWKLQSSTKKVSYHISVTHNNLDFMIFIAIAMSLFGYFIGASMEVLLECFLDSRPVFGKICFYVELRARWNDLRWSKEMGKF